MKPGGASPHAPYEDALAILIGTLLVSLGILIYAKVLLVTGGVTGMALLIAYVTPVGFWISLFVLNLPCYWFAWRWQGRSFLLRTMAAVGIECFVVHQGPAWIDIAWIDPLCAAVVGGALMGVGLMGLFRHNTSLGGIGALAFYLQERHGIRAGYVQMAFDGSIMLAATAVLPAQNMLLSIIGALVMNGVLVIYHRSDRYVGVT
ncbi:YitT family protein [Methylobacterium sp. BTF04]|nr:YitT family protein [Methylobacterium sp. BTF04]